MTAPAWVNKLTKKYQNVSNDNQRKMSPDIVRRNPQLHNKKIHGIYSMAAAKEQKLASS